MSHSKGEAAMVALQAGAEIGGERCVDRQQRLDVILPVYNAEPMLCSGFLTLYDYLDQHCYFDWRIVIVDNGSVDNTPRIARSLAGLYDRTYYCRIPLKGRGRALRMAWLQSDADILSYMDIDMSTDLKAFIPLLESISWNGADVAIGSRFREKSDVQRSFVRSFLSRGFMGLIKTLFPGCHFSDAQCGFKAIRRNVAAALLPRIKNDGWFFDTELLLLADRLGFRISQVPVHWIEHGNSTVRILQTITEHFLGVVRMRFAFLAGSNSKPIHVNHGIKIGSKPA